MANLKEFLDNIKPIKFWHIKDTYYFLQSVGNHWFLKKYLVLYNIFLVRNLKLTEEVRIEIRDNFLSFCNKPYRATQVPKSVQSNEPLMQYALDVFSMTA